MQQVLIDVTAHFGVRRRLLNVVSVSLQKWLAECLGRRIERFT